MFPLPHVREPTSIQCGAHSVVANGDLQGFRKKCVAPTRPVQGFETFRSDLRREVELVQCLLIEFIDINFDHPDFAKKRRFGMYFVYHVDKGLGIVPLEEIDRVGPILVREDRLNQGGKFVRDECASDQTFTS